MGTEMRALPDLNLREPGPRLVHLAREAAENEAGEEEIGQDQDLPGALGNRGRDLAEDCRLGMLDHRDPDPGLRDLAEPGRDGREAGVAFGLGGASADQDHRRLAVTSRQLGRQRRNDCEVVSVDGP